MNTRLLSILFLVALTACDGGESQPASEDERTSFVDSDVKPAADEPQRSVRDGVPACPDRSDSPGTDNVIDERGLFELSGPVRRVEEHFAGYTLSKSNLYEQDPLELRRVLEFDADGQLVDCRTNLGPGVIGRDDQGRLATICMPVGSGTLRQRDIKIFDGWGRLAEHWTLGASGEPITRSLAVHDGSGRMRTMRTDSFGIMTTLTIRHWTYDDQGRVDSIQIVNNVGEPINTTSYNYNLGARTSARQQVRGPDGRRLESTDMTLDDAGNWTVRIRSKFRKDSEDRWQEQQYSIRRQTIDYFDEDAAESNRDGVEGE